MIRQLIVQGYLRVDHEGYGALKLTERSRPLLRGEVALKLRHDTSKPVAAKKPRATDRTVSDEDRELWEALRECRRVLAAEQGVPPYVIFHDTTLAEMARARPADPHALLAVSGVGQAKLERYGERFLGVIRAAAGTNDASCVRD